MRLGLQRGLLLLAAYLAGVAALAWWLDRALEDAATAMIDDAARLVASEVGSALHGNVVERLMHGSPADRLGLVNQVLALTKASSTVRSVEVVDERGEVFASDDFVAVGRREATPLAVFGGSPRPLLLSEQGGRHEQRRYVLAVPLPHHGSLVGYLRLTLDSSHLGRVTRALRRRLFYGALAGLLLVAGIAYGLHLQLRRRNAQLVAALERAGRGEDGASEPEEFGPAVALAGRLGRELQVERRRGVEGDRRLRRLAEMMDVGLLLLSKEREVEFASDRARQLFGVPAEPSAADWRQALEPLEGILQRPTADRANGRQMDLEVLRSGNRRQIRCQVYPLDEEGNAGSLLQARDREVLQAVEIDLRMAAQQRALTRVYRGVAHDLRAPLNAMVLNLELLKRSLDPEASPHPDRAAKQQRWVGILEQEVQRLRRALEVLLAQTAPPSEKPEPFDLRSVLEEIEDLLYPQARQQHVRITRRVPESEVTVNAYRDQIKQSVLNIAINALEAMPDEGLLELSLDRQGNVAQITVTDSGPGIPLELRDRIFDMHFTTKQSGTGIGLYVARSMFESQGGTVQTGNSGPEGTTFTLTLPLQRQGS